MGRRRVSEQTERQHSRESVFDRDETGAKERREQMMT